MVTDANKFDILRMNLVEYFQQIEKYQIHHRKWRLKKNKNRSVYLINLFNKSYQVIKIIDFLNQKQIWSALNLKENQMENDGFRKEIITANHSKFQILTIVITEQVHEPLMLDNNDAIIFVNSETAIAQLKSIYSQVDQLPTMNAKNNVDDDDFDPSMITSDDLKEDSPLRKKMKEFHNITTKQNVFLSYVFAFLPLLVPILVPILIPKIRDLLQTQSGGVFSGNGVEFQLIFGGVYKHLVFVANQYWRLFVYPLAGDGSHLNLFLSCLIIFYSARLVESFYKPWKLAVLIFFTTAIVGLAHAVILGPLFFKAALEIPNVLSGPFYWVIAVTIPLYIYSFTKKDFAAFVIRRRLIMPSIFIAISFILNAERLALPIITTAFVSFFLSYFLGYNGQIWDWKRFASLAIMVVFIVILIILQVTDTQIFTDYGWLKNVLNNYVKLGVITSERMDEILSNI